MTFREMTIKILTETKIPMSPEEIWEAAIKKGYDKAVESKGKTPVLTVGARIYTEKDKTLFVKVGQRPVRFTLKNFSKEVIFPNNEKIPSKYHFLEKNLHPLLSYFMFTKMQIHSKSINHSLSKRKEFGEWVHPDMVGWYFQSRYQ